MWQEYFRQQALIEPQNETKTGFVAWQSPSNIALVKYWGKHGNQLPNNPSVSLTLSVAHTRTQILWQPKTGKGIELKFFFDGKVENAFQLKIVRFLEHQLDILPFIESFSLRIESWNTFPHSSGIASSASSMSALVMCLLDMEQQLRSDKINDDILRRKASWLARQASGSAARSIFPHVGIWGETAFEGSTDEFAVPMPQLHSIFKKFRDSILIIHSGSKSVSSCIGHTLMEGNPFAEIRYAQARQNTLLMLEALQSGDLETFIHITEAEALQLHALMMTSNPSFVLMKPASLTVIEKIRDFRTQTGIPLCFTLDAGPNVHLLYPDEYQSKVRLFIEEELLKHCEQGQWLDDYVGTGPSRL